MLAYKLYIVFEDWWTLCLYVVLDIFLSFVVSGVVKCTCCAFVDHWEKSVWSLFGFM